MDDFIRLEEVRKIYQTGQVVTKAVDGINFTISEGEFVVIIGASGAGKTTILNILGGMDTVTSGSVFVDGNDIAKYSRRQLTQYRRNEGQQGAAPKGQENGPHPQPWDFSMQEQGEAQGGENHLGAHQHRGGGHAGTLKGLKPCEEVECKQNAAGPAQDQIPRRHPPQFRTAPQEHYRKQQEHRPAQAVGCGHPGRRLGKPHQNGTDTDQSCSCQKPGADLSLYQIFQ